MITQDHRSNTRAERRVFEKVGKADRQYAAALKRLARQVGDIINGYSSRLPDDLSALLALLNEYAVTIRPWAKVAADRMLIDVMRRDDAAWRKLGRDVGRSLREEIASAPIGQLVHSLLDEQVELITSIPVEAGRRVHKLVTENITTGQRFDVIRDEILKSSSVAVSRATLIARTETARAASTITQARAEHIDSPGYFWRTAKDGDVRSAHKKMEGKFIKWDEPPTLSDGTTTHAGQIYNCRCWAEVIIPEEFMPRRKAA